MFGITPEFPVFLSQGQTNQLKLRKLQNEKNLTHSYRSSNTGNNSFCLADDKLQLLRKYNFLEQLWQPRLLLRLMHKLWLNRHLLQLLNEANKLDFHKINICFNAVSRKVQRSSPLCLAALVATVFSDKRLFPMIHR